ncbi:MAG: tetratricopeptide repeat protein [Lachnospiraceae bacterium]|nr:tetratricopeptide repeat protein [Lachnospiraceae bacterium]
MGEYLSHKTEEDIRYANQLFEERKYEESLAAFETLAQNGFARAWYDVGFQYERGIGTSACPEKAIAAYEQGAKQGNSTCQTRLGKLLLWGKLVQKDEAQAYFWICKAAEQNDEIAKMWKGHCMTYGLGTPEDLKSGLTLLNAALDYNYPNEGTSQQMAEQSQFDWDEDMLQLFWDLGEAFETGRGFPKRDNSAGYYYSMVAAGGWPKAIEKMTHYKESKILKRWKRIN